MKMPDEPVFVDTNILLCATDKKRKQHVECLELFNKAFHGTGTLIINSQVIREYLVVTTRPVEVNGLGLVPEKAIENANRFQSVCHVVDDNKTTTNTLIELVQKWSLKGKKIHDANIVATMIANGIQYLLTLNPDDFSIFENQLAIISWSDS